MNLRILRPEDIDTIIAFERQRLEKKLADPMEREMASWSAPWRVEALNHYLPLGWSFGAFDPNTAALSGYVLAQPLLFVRGLTQSLWVEHFAHDSPETGRDLLEAAWRWARDKHFQQLVLGTNEAETLPLIGALGAKAGDGRFLTVASSRMKQ
jgi:hypothetical protein